MRYKEFRSFKRKINFYNELFFRSKKLSFAWYRFKWNCFPILNIVPNFPLHIDIEVTDACNLRCIMCVHGSGKKIKTGFADADFVKSIIKQSAEGGASSIKLNWRGEPALYKELPDLISYAKQNSIQEVQINTNGLPFTEDSIHRTIDSGLDRVIFSVDGNSKETYEKIRVGGDFKKLTENIESFLKIRKELKRVKPFIRVQMVRMKDNKHECNGFYKRWENKVDDIRISDVTDRGQGGYLCVGDQVAVGRRKCPQPWQRMVVNREGFVLPCCSDWYCQQVIGDAKRDSLNTIWKGTKMREFRKNVSEKRLDEFEPCKSCFVKESYIWKYKRSKNSY